MRHRKAGRHFSRTSAHRRAMLKNLASALLQHEVIRTTVPKAKELRRVAEPLITLGKEDTTARRRRAFAKLRDKALVTKLFDELGPRYRERPGGYMRVLRCGYRAGDSAPMALVELVGQPVEGEEDELPTSKAAPEAAQQDESAGQENTEQPREQSAGA